MINRLFVEKKQGYNVACKKLKNDFTNSLNCETEDIRIFIRYDIQDLDSALLNRAKTTVFSETPIDYLYEDELPLLEGYRQLVVELLPGQYDQRADSAMQCVQLLTMGKRPLIKCATVYAIKGVNDIEWKSIKAYIINPVEAREGDSTIPDSLELSVDKVNKIATVANFINYTSSEIKAYHSSKGFAMSIEDLEFVAKYFAKEKRNPTETELKVIDTYWSDHCRHTTFSTEITSVKINSNNPHIVAAFNEYVNLFNKFYANRDDKYKCLMSIATIAVKELKEQGLLNNLDTSDEINACSVVVNIDVDGKDEEWLIMFKNETHNHPTEIEPFGGAATCLGGAIRDPLSGRTYVYQAMRVTGSADPTMPISTTMKGKLPQRVITKTAAAGYSSYGNQIGLSTGLVSEMYHDGYKAKRLETGYVIAGAPRANIVRRKPIEGDVVILVGGDTGRDGCGGATGSSKAHTQESVDMCGAEVQKGNPPTERKIQRLFRNPNASKLIIKCNDFGAGGVSVAIGELADSLEIYLDKVPKKYAGLNGTELAISESQERMAVVLDKSDVIEFTRLANEENLTATVVAEIKNDGYLRMFWEGDMIVSLSRQFLDTNGVKQMQDAIINDNATNYIDKVNDSIADLIAQGKYIDALSTELSRLNVCSSKGLGEMFDGTIGASSSLMPFGGKYQLTPAIAMAAKPPVNGHTDTVTVSAYGCNPNLMSASPFTGSIYSIIASVSKLVACGVRLDTVRLTLQEYFKRLGKDAVRWGEPLSALLGALHAQLGLGLGAIGGKDSMSGSFENIDVPPTLISFAMGVMSANKLVHNAFNRVDGAKIYFVKLPTDSQLIPIFDRLKSLYSTIADMIDCGKIRYCNVIDEGGAISAIAKSCLGNKVGFDIINPNADMFKPYVGSFVIVTDDISSLKEFDVIEVARFNDTLSVNIGDNKVKLNDLITSFESKLDGVFPTTAAAEGDVSALSYFSIKKEHEGIKIAQPRVFIPVFPGTNCEYDTSRAFCRANAIADVFVIKNQTPKDIEDSVSEMVKRINNSQILAFPGGFSGGDEPDGSGKFIATTFKNPMLAEAVMNLLYNRDGLALGICNGFQALIKLGLVPYGDIREQRDIAPTLTFNNIKRHVSTIAQVRVATNKSPWLSGCKVGDVFNVALSHGEGRFVSSQEELDKIIKSGQIATQYVDIAGQVTMKSPYNPNGSMYAIEGIISPDGRVFGKMGHSERIDNNLYKNVEGNYNMMIFESGVKYYS